MKYVCISQDSLHGIREAPFTVQNTKPTDGTEGIQTSTVSPGDDEVSQSKGSGSEKKKKTYTEITSWCVGMLLYAA